MATTGSETGAFGIDRPSLLLPEAWADLYGLFFVRKT